MKNFFILTEGIRETWFMKYSFMLILLRRLLGYMGGENLGRMVELGFQLLSLVCNFYNRTV